MRGEEGEEGGELAGLPQSRHPWPPRAPGAVVWVPSSAVRAIATKTSPGRWGRLPPGSCAPGLSPKFIIQRSTKPSSQLTAASGSP